MQDDGEGRSLPPAGLDLQTDPLRLQSLGRRLGRGATEELPLAIGCCRVDGPEPATRARRFQDRPELRRPSGS